jgi:exosortase A-associated hydrolase 2
VSFTPFFLKVPDGERFCIHHPAASAEPRGLIVYLHPFAEEMNKARRMAALQSRAFADAGFSVLQLDLKGCGDSSGDFADATWSGWIDDAVAAAHWLRDQGRAPLWFWGLRTGALLATAAAVRSEQPASLILWNPVLSGSQFLSQFLRLKVAAHLGSGARGGTVTDYRDELSAGRPVDVAGYTVSPALATGLAGAELEALAADCAPRAIRWIETSSSPELSPVVRRCANALTPRCPDLRVVSVAGPAFWQTAEIETVPGLITASVGEIVAAS